MPETEIRDGKEYKVTRLPDDWQLTPEATRSRTLWQAADKVGRKAEAERKRAATWKRRRKKT